MSRTFLLATDGSEPSQRAIDHFARIGRPDDKIVVVHVIPDPDEGYLGNTYESIISEKKLRSSAEELTDEVLEEITELGFEGRSQVLKGHTGETICDFADEIEADGIIVGRKGKSALTETLLGSISQYIIHHARVPVIVVP